MLSSLRYRLARRRAPGVQPPRSPPRRANAPGSPPRPAAPSAPPTSAPSTTAPRLARLHARLPRRLQPLVAPVLRAPLSHVTAFLLLHELTALAPLLGLVGALRWSGGLEGAHAWAARWAGEERLREAQARMERWLKRRGWVAAEEEPRVTVAEEDVGKKGAPGGAGRLVLEFATAYAITKLLLPLRLAVSVAAAPWFARTTVVPCANLARRILGRPAGPAGK